MSAQGRVGIPRHSAVIKYGEWSPFDGETSRFGARSNAAEAWLNDGNFDAVKAAFEEATHVLGQAYRTEQTPDGVLFFWTDDSVPFLLLQEEAGVRFVWLLD